MNKTLEEFNKKSQEYSFNIDSALFPTLSKPQQIYWKHELENAFYNGCICANDLFTQGSEWADKTMIDNICQWIREKAEYNKNLFYNAYLGNVDFLIEELKDDMLNGGQK